MLLGKLAELPPRHLPRGAPAALQNRFGDFQMRRAAGDAIFAPIESRRFG